MSRVILLVSILLVPSYADAQCGGGFFGRARTTRSYSGSAGCGSYYSSNGCGSYYSSYGCGSYNSSDGCVISRTASVSGCCEVGARTEPLPEKFSPIRTDQPNDDLPNTPLPAAPKYPSELDGDVPTPTDPVVIQTSYRTAEVVGQGVIVINVPVTSQVWINGMLTKTSGQNRRYASVGLAEGRQYAYHIVVRNGDQQTVRDVVLRSGQTLMVR